MRTILITGAGKRGGAAIAQRLHARGYRVILHCRQSSRAKAEVLRDELNSLRPDSACVWPEELSRAMSSPPWVFSIMGIVANASEYVATDIDQYSERIDADLNTHLHGHMTLIEICKASLIKNNGSIVAITDISIARPHKGHLSYLIAKGALATAMRALAIELAPHVRVNMVAPGPLDWPENNSVDESLKKTIIDSTPLGRTGRFDELVTAVEFLLLDATFCTGTTLNVDGGRSIFMEN